MTSQVTDADVASFVERFTKNWAAVSEESFLNLFHENGCLLHPGMREPLPRDQIPAYVGRIKRTAPDISLTPTRHARTGDSVFIEWTMRCTIRGKSVEWSGMDRFDLRGDRAVYGIAYFDQVPLYLAVDPSLPLGELLDAVAD